MNTKRKALWIAVAAAGFAMAGAARGQDEFGFEDESAPAAKPVYENYIEIGAGYTSDGNGKFGEYTTGITDAMQDDGGFPVGGLRLSGGDDATARYWDVTAGIGNGRGLEANYGIQGNFGLTLYGDRVEKTEYGEAGTVYGSASDLMLIRPGYLTDFPDPAPPALSTTASTVQPGNPAFYNTEDIRHERQILGLTGFKQIGNDWSVSLGFENQQKSGDDVFGGNQGFGGTALVPEELDGETLQVRARVDYATLCLQNGIELYMSDYSGGNDAIAFQNAVYTGSVSAGDFKELGIEQVAMEPDNRFMRLGMDGGYTFDAMTRLSWFLDWSRGEQDDNFLPVVLDTNYYPSVNPVFPFSNLDGEVERRDLKLSLVGRPFARFDYRVQYAYKNRDAKHDPLPVNELSYNYNSTSPGFTSKVYDKETQTLSADLGYRFGGGVKLRGGYAYEQMDRDTDELEYLAPVYTPASFTDSTDEDRLWAELSITSLENLTIKLRGEYNVISADLSDETEEMISPLGGPRRATPAFLLDRDQDVYGLELDYALGSSASVYARYDLVKDDYDNDTFGLDSRDSKVLSAGFSWSPSKAVNLSAYASRENYEIEQLQRYMNQSGTTPYADWNLDTEDEVDAFGVTFDWAVVEDRFDLSAELAYMDSQSSYSSTLGTTTYAPLPSSAIFGDTPDVTDELLRFNLSGVYHWSDQIDVTARYIYENRDAEDWGWSDVISPAPVAPAVADPTQGNARFLAFAWERPDYSSQLFVMSLRYKF